MSGFKLKDDLLYVSNFTYFLKGITFGGSAFSKTAFQVHAFVLPLFVPTEFLYFSYYPPAKRGNWWELIPEKEEEVFGDIQNYLSSSVIPFFNQIHTPKDFWRKYPTPKEASAYALLLSGNYKASQEMMQDFIELLDKDLREEPIRPWVGVVRDRVLRIKSLSQTEPSKAVAQLDDWTAEAIDRFKLVADGPAGMDFVRLRVPLTPQEKKQWLVFAGSSIIGGFATLLFSQYLLEAGGDFGLYSLLGGSVFLLLMSITSIEKHTFRATILSFFGSLVGVVAYTRFFVMHAAQAVAALRVEPIGLLFNLCLLLTGVLLMLLWLSAGYIKRFR